MNRHYGLKRKWKIFICVSLTSLILTVAVISLIQFKNSFWQSKYEYGDKYPFDINENYHDINQTDKKIQLSSSTELGILLNPDNVSQDIESFENKQTVENSQTEISNVNSQVPPRVQLNSEYAKLKLEYAKNRKVKKPGESWTSNVWRTFTSWIGNSNFTYTIGACLNGYPGVQYYFCQKYNPDSIPWPECCRELPMNITRKDSSRENLIAFNDKQK